MTAVSPLKYDRSEVIEMSDNNGKQELIEADNDDDNEYVDNDDNNPEQPKGELKRKRPTVKKKINPVSYTQFIVVNLLSCIAMYSLFSSRCIANCTNHNHCLDNYDYFEFCF